MQWGLSPATLSQSAQGTNLTFTTEYDSSLPPRNITVHTATMSALAPLTRYYYRVGDPLDGWSSVYTFVTLGPVDTYPADGLHVGVWGDMGWDNAQSLAYIENDVQNGWMDVAVHVGDFGALLVGTAFIPIELTCRDNDDDAAAQRTTSSRGMARRGTCSWTKWFPFRQLFLI